MTGLWDVKRKFGEHYRSLTLRKWGVYRNPNILPQKAENAGLPESCVILEQKTPLFGGILWVVLF
jgi:hypothetical protein